MDYEKKYKELIEKIELISHSALTVEQHQIIDIILGELKESEDEEVRKEIITFISTTPKQRNRHPKWINWLEKQGDSPIKWNKNTKDCKPKVSHSVLMKTTHGIADGEWQGEYWHQYRWAGLVRDTDVLSWIELSDLEKQGEKEPTIEMKTPEESLGIDSETYNKIVDECIYSEQKPNYTTLVETGNGRINALVTKEITNGGDFESENCKQKPSWNEEDEKFLKQAIEEIDYALNDKDLFYNGTSPIVDWLKSLKDRCDWKPSDEQMELLKDASARYEGLQSLYNDLNKLKGE